ncbi:MAG: glycosyltransferase family 1 protein [Halioglobus sp.]|nr:glycosyltransferase family 1 protein [Halioglobus sp.]
MKLIFNAEALRPPVTGVGYYSYHLLEQLVLGDDVETVDCFTGTHWQDGRAQLAATAALLSDGGDAQPGSPLVRRMRAAIGMIPGTKALYDFLMERRFERHANANAADAVYHETNYILKPYRGACVTTVHDLSHIRFPQFHPPHVVERLNRLLPRSLERADAVITVSNVVREEILEQYHLPAGKVHTIYEGVDERYKPRTPAETAAVLERYGLRHGNYVLLVATLEPRKGIDLLLAAWEHLPAVLRREYPLVLTGSSGWRNEQLRARLDALVGEGTARHLGYVPADCLPDLYSGAALFCYPSVYEGFGLPVLDAMRSGVPAICRAGTSMAEFSAGACPLLETGEPEELAATLERLLENPEERASWGRKGRERAAAFSWARCARETAEIYRRIA